MHGYRITKYDPALRNEHGHFDDWTSISDVGKTSNGVELTMERYLEVESAYLAAVEAFAVESEVDRLALRIQEAHNADPALLPVGLLDVLCGRGAVAVRTLAAHGSALVTYM